MAASYIDPRTSHNSPTRKSNQRKYWMCGRCDHRWAQMNVKRTSTDYNPPPMDQFGDTEPRPIKESCPCCRSKYNIRSFTDFTEGANNSKEALNYDPFNGMEINDVIARIER